jgi:nitroimidazol reductase NimA-like FMN-containing flavoprotein (pyridoxamine 5'-phosphate oxidase superfamily)
MSSQFEITERNRVRRLPERGRYERGDVYAILDSNFLCHVGFVQDGQPFVIPTNYGRLGDEILLHGSAASRMMKHLAAGNAACITVTLVDGLVLARSGFHSSINYRSAMVYGHGVEITEPAQKNDALYAISENICPGRWSDIRGPNPQELKGTSVVRVPIESASAKVRTGPPKDEEEDYSLGIWAGVLPLHTTTGELIPDPRLPGTIKVPEYLRRYIAAKHRNGNSRE